MITRASIKPLAFIYGFAISAISIIGRRVIGVSGVTYHEQ